MGSRYGGLKQIEPVGPSGETVLDYSVHDALRAGFGKLVFVIRRDFEEAFRQNVARRFETRVEVRCVFQETGALPGGRRPPAGREKPWGTGHAVWCARDALREPFAVINADDFYGADAFRQIAAFFNPNSRAIGLDCVAWASRPCGSGGTGVPPVVGAHKPAHGDNHMGGTPMPRNPTGGTPVPPDPIAGFGFKGAGAPAPCCMVGYRLDATLSEHGTVARGICTTDTHGFLQDVTECTAIERLPGGGARQRAPGGAERVFTGAETVSMNCWGFTPGVLPALERELVAFLGRDGAALKSEFYLPAAVAAMIANRDATVRVLPTTASWFGITYREDRQRVVAALAALAEKGEYPKQKL